jgi:hypothetical protein
MDVLHSSLDTIATTLGRPESLTTMGVAKDTAASAGEVLLGYPGAIVRCSASALLPKPYGMRGGYRAVFTDAAIEQLDRRLGRPPHHHPDRVHRAGQPRGRPARP